MISRFLIGAGLVIVTSLALLTFHAATVWQGEGSVWDHALTLAPNRPRVLINAAHVRLQEGRAAEAVALLARAERASAVRGGPRVAVFREPLTVSYVLAYVALQERARARQYWETLPASPVRESLAWVAYP